MKIKASLPLRILNISLVLATAWLLLVTSFLMFSRERHEETSRWIYGADSPLMDSAVLDVVINPAFGIALVLFAVLALAKEKFLRLDVHKKVLLNIGALTVSALLFVLLSQSLITPSAALMS